MLFFYPLIDRSMRPQETEESIDYTEEEPINYLEALPEEIWVLIFLYLPLPAAIYLARTCKRFLSISKDIHIARAQQKQLLGATISSRPEKSYEELTHLLGLSVIHSGEKTTRNIVDINYQIQTPVLLKEWKNMLYFTTAPLNIVKPLQQLMPSKHSIAAYTNSPKSIEKTCQSLLDAYTENGVLYSSEEKITEDLYMLGELIRLANTQSDESPASQLLVKFKELLPTLTYQDQLFDITYNIANIPSPALFCLLSDSLEKCGNKKYLNVRVPPHIVNNFIFMATDEPPKQLELLTILIFMRNYDELIPNIDYIKDDRYQLINILLAPFKTDDHDEDMKKVQRLWQFVYRDLTTIKKLIPFIKQANKQSDNSFMQRFLRGLFNQTFFKERLELIQLFKTHELILDDTPIPMNWENSSGTELKLYWEKHVKPTFDEAIITAAASIPEKLTERQELWKELLLKHLHPDPTPEQQQALSTWLSQLSEKNAVGIIKTRQQNTQNPFTYAFKSICEDYGLPNHPLNMLYIAFGDNIKLYISFLDKINGAMPTYRARAALIMLKQPISTFTKLSLLKKLPIDQFEKFNSIKSLENLILVLIENALLNSSGINSELAKQLFNHLKNRFRIKSKISCSACFLHIKKMIGQAIKKQKYNAGANEPLEPSSLQASLGPNFAIFTACQPPVTTLKCLAEPHDDAPAMKKAKLEDDENKRPEPPLPRGPHVTLYGGYSSPLKTPQTLEEYEKLFQRRLDGL